MDKLIRTKVDRFWHPEASARDRWVEAQAVQLPPGAWILDAGAGASKYRPFFGHCRYETQDFCKYDGPLVKYLEPITYVCDMTAIPLPSGCLDAILCTEVIEHVVDPMAVLREFSRLLKPGGRLLLTAPSASQLHMEPWHFYGGFTAQWYRHWLPITGFEVKSVTPVGGPGHLAVYFLQDLYASLRSQEHRKPPFARLVSKFNRALLKPWVHWLLPGPLRRIDKCLDTAELGSGFMVASVRRSKET